MKAAGHCAILLQVYLSQQKSIRVKTDREQLHFGIIKGSTVATQGSERCYLDKKQMAAHGVWGTAKNVFVFTLCFSGLFVLRKSCHVCFALI
jgi:hypothetical protein